MCIMYRPASSLRRQGLIRRLMSGELRNNTDFPKDLRLSIVYTRFGGSPACWLNYTLEAGTKGRSRIVSGGNDEDVVRKELEWFGTVAYVRHRGIIIPVLFWGCCTPSSFFSILTCGFSWRLANTYCGTRRWAVVENAQRIVH